MLIESASERTKERQTPQKLGDKPVNTLTDAGKNAAIAGTIPRPPPGK